MFCPFTLGVVILIVAYYVIDLALRSLKIGKVTEKHVLITGCDSGFGRLAASRLDQLGFNVFAACLTKDGAQSLSGTCSSRLTTLNLDVASTESIEQAVRLVHEKLPPDTGLWALINNAGISGLYAPCEFCTKQDVIDVFNVNFLGAFEVTRHFLPLIRKCKGRVVNTSSVAGRFAAFMPPYTLSKHGIECFSDLLRREVRNQGIKVSVIEPGAFKTPIYTDNLLINSQKAFDKQSPQLQAVYGGANFAVKMKKISSMIEKFMVSDINPVVDAYIHAITSKFPRIRYVVGTDAKLFYIPITYLPDGVVDFILDRLM